MSTTVQRVALEPNPSDWAARALAHWAITLREPKHLAFRAALGLPTDRPIVMSGHQAAFWHMGIVAKVIAADETARRCAAASAWVVVDQDEAEFDLVNLPVRDGAKRLSALSCRLAPQAPKGVASGSLPPFHPKAIRPDISAVFALPSVAWGAATMTESLLSRQGEQSAAMQVAHAAFDILESVIPSPTLFGATSISNTELFQSLLARMRAHPAALRAAYNDAIARFPQAGLAPLRAEHEARIELPIWSLQPGAPRQRVWSSDPLAPERRLAPKALLLTGLLRLAGCDLFIHGAGGAIYDQATEAWLATWLNARLAPTVMATADVFLPLHEQEVTARDVARAQWLAHHARHTPELAQRPDLQAEKSRLVERVRAIREQGADPLPAYRTLHRMLDEYRIAAEPTLARLQSDARETHARFAESAIARDRTWPFPAHDSTALKALAQAIRHAFR